MSGLQLEGHKLYHHADRVADFLSGRAVWPIYVEISPTSTCNHRCRFCNFNYLGHGGQNLPNGRMLGLVEELAQGRVKALVFAGAGEPSLHPDTFPSIRRAREFGLDVAMSTNGALLRDEQLDEMAELLTWVRFSINGGTPEAYAAAQGARAEDLDKALSALEKLSSRKMQCDSTVTIGAQCVLTPENRFSIRMLAEKIKAAGADYFSIKHFYPHDDNLYQPDMSFLTDSFVNELRGMAVELSDSRFSCVVRDMDSLERNRPYTQCLGLPFIIYVREDGMLYSCFSHQDDEKTVIGNLFEHDFPTLWNSVGKTESIRHINQCYDKNLCQANCRHHQINLWLWQLRNPPAHVNFI